LTPWCGDPTHNDRGEPLKHHLTVKFNVPDSLIHGPISAQDRLAANVEVVTAFWEAVEALKASEATAPAVEPQRPVLEAPAGSQGHAKPVPLPITNHEECLSCQ